MKKPFAQHGGCFVAMRVSAYCSRSKGFSLVELLVVVAILAILAAIAIPLFLNQRTKAAQGVVVSDAKNFASSLSSSLKSFPTSSSPALSYNGTEFTLSSGGQVEVFQTTTSPDVNIVLRQDSDMPQAVIFSNPSVADFVCVVSAPPAGGVDYGVEQDISCGEVVSEQGNLLNYEQAYARLGGVGWGNPTPAFSSEQFTDSSFLVKTVTTTTSGSVCFLVLSPEVGATYGFSANISVSGSSARPSRVITQPQNSSGVSLGTQWGNLIYPGDSGVSKVWHTIPADTARMLICPLYTSSPVAGDEVVVSEVAFWKGPDSGVWSPPGRPLLNP